eukprot:288160-Chlamydomonas_euryale.AAC.6
MDRHWHVVAGLQVDSRATVPDTWQGYDTLGRRFMYAGINTDIGRLRHSSQPEVAAQGTSSVEHACHQQGELQDKNSRMGVCLGDLMTTR